MKNTVYRNSVPLLIAWILIIFILCATPGDYIPSSDWMELLSVDKLIHAAMFFVLSALFFITAIKYKQGLFVVVIYFILSVLYGLSLELMQSTFFRNRSTDWKDVVANTLGCLIALMFLKK